MLKMSRQSYRVNAMENYSHLPFFFKRMPYGVLLTNDIGEHHVMQGRDFDIFLKSPNSISVDTRYDLEGKFFCTSNITDEMVEIYATRYRTKKYFLFESTSLHMLVITQRCNQSCIYCHASSEAYDSNQLSDMNIETAKLIIQNILSSPSKIIKIEFQGGEPTLNFKIIRYVVGQKGIFTKRGKMVTFVVCSNLLHVSDDDVEFLIENRISVSTSLDGPAHLHDLCRVTNFGEPTYERIVKSLIKFRENGHDDISALLTIHRGNIAYLCEIIDEYVRLGFSSVFIRGINPFGRYEQNREYLEYQQSEFIDAYKRGVEYIIELNRSGIIITEEYFSMMARRIMTPFGCGFVDMQSPTGNAICGLMYDVNGNVFASDEARMIYRSHADAEFLLGNVHKDGRKEWFHSEKVNNMLKNSVLDCIPGCSWCVFSPYCGIDAVRVYHKARLDGGVKDVCGNKKALFEYIFSKIYSEDVFVRKLVRSWARMN